MIREYIYLFIRWIYGYKNIMNKTLFSFMPCHAIVVIIRYHSEGFDHITIPSGAYGWW